MRAATRRRPGWSRRQGRADRLVTAAGSRRGPVRPYLILDVGGSNAQTWLVVAAATHPDPLSSPSLDPAPRLPEDDTPEALRAHFRVIR